MSDCRVLGGRFQGPGTSCGGHYTKPVMYQSEEDQFLAELVEDNRPEQVITLVEN